MAEYTFVQSNIQPINKLNLNLVSTHRAPLHSGDLAMGISPPNSTLIHRKFLLWTPARPPTYTSRPPESNGKPGFHHSEPPASNRGAAFAAPENANIHGNRPSTNCCGLTRRAGVCTDNSKRRNQNHLLVGRRTNEFQVRQFNYLRTTWRPSFGLTAEATQDAMISLYLIMMFQGKYCGIHMRNSLYAMD